MAIELSQHLFDTVATQTEYDKYKIYCRACVLDNIRFSWVYITGNNVWLKEFVFIITSHVKNSFIL